MAKESSFDIVSEFDQQELVNALDQTRRELTTRYDLKDKGSTLELVEDKEIIVTTTDDFSLRSIIEIMENKVVKRGLSPLILAQEAAVEDSLGGKMRQKITLKKGIDKELAKKIVTHIKETKLKVQSSIQGEQVRVTGKDKDILQEIMAGVRTQADEWNTPLQFTNYR